MAKNKIGLQFAGFDEYVRKLDALEGDVKTVTEEALKESKTLVTTNLQSVVNKANYPAHGKYARRGDPTRASIDTALTVSWEGTLGEIKIGFDLKESGMTSIFLMYGTPRMSKMQGLYDAVYGSRTKNQVKKIQQEVFSNAIKKKMEG